MTEPDRSSLPIRRPPFAGVVNKTLEGSQPDWNQIGHPVPPQGAPNVLLVLIDDAGFGMTEIPVSHYPRLHGRSEFFRFRHLTQTLKGLLRIWWNLVLSRWLPVWMTTAARKS